MNQRTQQILLGVLVLVFVPSAFFFYRSLSPEARAPQPVSLDSRFAPLNVDNPALRMDILKRFLALEYTGVHRSIFSMTLPPPPAPPAPPPAAAVVSGPPPGPPPLSVDAKFFGYVSDLAGDHRRAFFATPNNEDVIIAGEGDTLMGRFRVLRITNTSADLEEISSNRRATLNLEQPGPNG